MANTEKTEQPSVITDPQSHAESDLGCAAPHLEKRWVFVSTSRQILLASATASYLTTSDNYVAFFQFPSPEYPYTATTDFGTDGYLARAQGDRVATSINNAIARTMPDQIVLLGLTDIEKGYLLPRWPREMIVEVQEMEEIPRVLGIEPNFAGDLVCQPSEVIRGLVQARFERKRLVFSETAASLPNARLTGANGLIAVEDGTDDLGGLMAVNLAFACSLDVIVLPQVSRESLRSLPRDLHDWRKDPSHHAFQGWKRHVRTALNGANLEDYKFASFFTQGLPYGLFLNNRVPFSHVFRFIDMGVLLANAINQEHEPDGFKSALLFSLSQFDSDETDEVVQTLQEFGMTPRLLRANEASVGNLHNFGAHYPYEILHICSHGGEANGYFTIQNFRDRSGVEHVLEYYEVVGIAPTSGSTAQVHRKLIFHKLDGYRWQTAPLKSLPKYIFEDLTKVIKSDWDVGTTRVPYQSPIELSCHIKCYESIHQGDFDRLAGFSNPIVFNNSCASSHQLALNFMNAGARCYIGTLWAIGNATAKRASVSFYRTICAGHTILQAFHKMVTSIDAKKYKDIYVFWGFPFSTLKKSEQDDTVVLRALMFYWLLCLTKASETKDSEVKRGFLPILKFVAEQIMSQIEGRNANLPDQFDEKAIQDIERDLPSQAERHSLIEMTYLDLPDALV